MDSATIFAIAIVASIVGATLLAVCGIMWWLGTRRVTLSARMIQASGMLNHVALAENQGARGSRYWTIQGQYDYEVGGRKYSGKRIALEFNGYNTKAAAERVVGDLRGGQTVTVWYDPNSPKTAVINRSPPARIRLYRILALLGLALVVLAAIAGVVSGQSI